MSLKARTHFNTICNICVFAPHWLPPPQCLACLRACTALKMRLQHFPPISVLTPPYAFTPTPLPSLRCGTPFGVGLVKAVLEGEITGKQF
ncbi:hypothetical protein O181_121320 [Austropuccinia psidii MF-1]|uniref:Uncharacterized protein n=1 Tax=Austropuccinia psidii MF-1 TaxID=1389203 RepID=A0A9Q3KM18_9BASI|nr:hypothetical protein [Austropuccinia psidii MF-1]